MVSVPYNTHTVMTRTEHKQHQCPSILFITQQKSTDKCYYLSDNLVIILVQYYY